MILSGGRDNMKDNITTAVERMVIISDIDKTQTITLSMADRSTLMKEYANYHFYSPSACPVMHLNQ